jgi:hypothetical protein
MVVRARPVLPAFITARTGAAVKRTKATIARRRTKVRPIASRLEHMKWQSARIEFALALNLLAPTGIPLEQGARFAGTSNHPEVGLVLDERLQRHGGASSRRIASRVATNVDGRKCDHEHALAVQRPVQACGLVSSEKVDGTLRGFAYQPRAFSPEGG